MGSSPAARISQEIVSPWLGRTEPAFVSEHEAEVILVWSGTPPEKFAKGETVRIGDDTWSIRYSAISN